MVNQNGHDSNIHKQNVMILELLIHTATACDAATRIF